VKRLLAAAMILCLLGFQLCGCGGGVKPGGEEAKVPEEPKAPEVVKIGHAVALTGDASIWGQSESNALKMWVEKVNEKYKNDPQRKQQELMKLYREHNINPLGMLKGCGFMLIQLPIFIGLYTLLYQVIDLRGAGFLWIDDLSAEDRLFSFGINLPFIGSWFNLLPIIVAVTQMLSAKFMQTPASDPQQVQMQKMMTWFMPLFILAITYRFPAGLMLYWLVSNLWQVVQQVYVNKVIRKPQQTPA